MSWNFKDYWEKHKEELNQKRRDRYREDKVYREHVRQAAKITYNTRKRQSSR
jgi:hypothetical protein